MDIVLWVSLCLLSAVGLVQAIGWAACFFARPSKRPGGCYITSLPCQPADLESRLRYAILRRRWSGHPGDILVLLLSGEPDAECMQIIAKMLEGEFGVFLCEPQELPGILKAFEEKDHTLC